MLDEDGCYWEPVLYFFNERLALSLEDTLGIGIFADRVVFDIRLLQFRIRWYWH